MTKAEAHKFVARWKRILIPWFARTESEALRDMERSCIGMMGGGLLIFTFTSTHILDSTFAEVIVVFSVFQWGFSLWLVLKFRAARRAFDESAIVNRKS